MSSPTHMEPLDRHRFRVTDGHSHAVEFEATSQATFVSGVTRALDEFAKDRPRHPKAPEQRLELHAYDGEGWVDVRCIKSRRILGARKSLVWKSPQHWWLSAERTSNTASHMQSHMAGLTEFLRGRPKPTALRIIK